MNDLHDLENKVKIAKFKLVFASVPLCTKFGEDMSNICSDMEQKTILNYLRDQEMSNISSDIEQKPFSMNLNDLCDLCENEVKVLRFKLDLYFALMPLYTKFGDDTSSISPDIGWKPSCICRHLK